MSQSELVLYILYGCSTTTLPDSGHAEANTMYYNARLYSNI